MLRIYLVSKKKIKSTQTSIKEQPARYIKNFLRFVILFYSRTKLNAPNVKVIYLLLIRMLPKLKHNCIVYNNLFNAVSALIKKNLTRNKRKRKGKKKNIFNKYLWYKIKNYVKKNKVKQKNTNYVNKRIQLNFLVKFKWNPLVYKLWRRKDAGQLIKQYSAWTKKIERTRQTNIKYTNSQNHPANLMLRLAHIHSILLIYKQKKKIKTKKKSARVTRKNSIFKTTSFIQTPYKNQSILWAPFSPRNIYSEPSCVYKFKKNNPLCNNPVLLPIDTFSTPIIIKKTTRFVIRLKSRINPSKLLKPNNNQTKSTIIKNMFSFYNSNLSTNNLHTHTHTPVNVLLKIQIFLDSSKTPTALKQLATYRYDNNPNLSLVTIKQLSNSREVYGINNFYPLFYFLFKLPKNVNTNNSISTIVSKLYVNFLHPGSWNKYKNFYTYFLINFLEVFLQKKIWIRCDIRDMFSPHIKNHINKWVYLNSYLYRRFNRLISIRELLEIIIIMFRTRDLQIFLIFIKRCFEQSHFKKHKKILLILFDTFKKNKKLLAELGARGFFFDIRGKVGVSGNAKKRHFSFSLGKTTNTSQNIRSYWQQINVWTPTGQMGITCYILF